MTHRPRRHAGSHGLGANPALYVPFEDDGENKRGGPKTTASQDRSCDKHEADYWIFSQIRSLASPGTNRPSAPVASAFGSAPPPIARRIFSISTTLSCSVTVAIRPTCPPNSTASDASTPNFSFNHLILFSRYSCAWGNLPGTIRALRTNVTAIGTSSHVVLFDKCVNSLCGGKRIDLCQKALKKPARCCSAIAGRCPLTSDYVAKLFSRPN